MLTRISPGLYQDDAGAVHLIVREYLTARGIPDTPENIAHMEAEARRIASRQGIPSINLADPPKGQT